MNNSTQPTEIPYNENGNNFEELDIYLDQQLNFMEHTFGVHNEVEVKPVNFTCKYDPERDSRVYMRAAVLQQINPFGIKDYRQRFLDKINPDIKEIIERNEDLPHSIISFLNDRYSKNQQEVDSRIQSIEESFNHVAPKLIRNLQAMYGIPFMHGEVGVYVTTSPVCPYNEVDGYFYISVSGGIRKDFLSYIKTGTHELNHFFWHNSKYPGVLSKDLSPAEIDLIKETITYFSEPDRKDIRPAEEGLTNLYRSREIWGSLDEVVEAAKTWVIDSRKGL